MKQNFKDALQKVLVHEGGWADHPNDPGGATMKGITLLTYRRIFGRDKNKEDLRHIEDNQLEQIYREQYWDICLCDELPTGVDYAVFDAAVNSGPGLGVRWLQAAVNANQDGRIGPNTLSKVKQHDPIQVTNALCDQRLIFLQSLSTWSTFGAGWGNRVAGVRVTAITMAGENLVDAMDVATVLDEDYDVTKKGSSGDWVRRLQRALEIQVDGDFGNNTESALVAWQQEHRLQADGIAGRHTYRALGLLA